MNLSIIFCLGFIRVFSRCSSHIVAGVFITDETFSKLKNIVVVVSEAGEFTNQLLMNESTAHIIITHNYLRSNEEYKQVFFPNLSENDFVFVAMEGICDGNARMFAGWERIAVLGASMCDRNINSSSDQTFRNLVVGYRDWKPFFHLEKRYKQFSGIEWNILTTIAERNDLRLEFNEHFHGNFASIR